MPRLSQAQLRQALRQPSEKALQRDVVRLLEQLGYVVMETGRPTKQARCPHCGTFFHPATGTANTAGTPDLYVAHPGGGKGRLVNGHNAAPNVWKALELKTPGTESLLGTLRAGRIRPEQQRLVDLGLSDIVTSAETALALVEELRK